MLCLSFLHTLGFFQLYKSSHRSPTAELLPPQCSPLPELRKPILASLASAFPQRTRWGSCAELLIAVVRRFLLTLCTALFTTGLLIFCGCFRWFLIFNPVWWYKQSTQSPHHSSKIYLASFPSSQKAPEWGHPSEADSNTCLMHKHALVCLSSVVTLSLNRVFNRNAPEYYKTYILVSVPWRKPLA